MVKLNIYLWHSAEDFYYNISVSDVCYLLMNTDNLFTQVDLVWDEEDLAGIFIHKWERTHEIYFILRFCQ